jgi:hypothetical protein
VGPICQWLGQPSQQLTGSTQSTGARGARGQWHGGGARLATSDIGTGECSGELPAVAELRRRRKSSVVHQIGRGLVLRIGQFTSRRTAVASRATVAGMECHDDAGGEVCSGGVRIGEAGLEEARARVRLARGEELSTSTCSNEHDGN